MQEKLNSLSSLDFIQSIWVSVGEETLQCYATTQNRLARKSPQELCLLLRKESGRNLGRGFNSIFSISSLFSSHYSHTHYL